MNWEIVAGVEVHVELSTRTKAFCSCANVFGAEPNTVICPVCMGMPGAMPALNKQVVEYAIKTGIALNCDISRLSAFDRKSYFYPDLPKSYQITQFDMPICKNGYLDIETKYGKKRIGIEQIHIEEDAGKLIHDVDKSCTMVDYNRCGVPLLEIVSCPNFSKACELTAYLENLREILLFLRVSDCKMQEGSLRVDLNVSVRHKGSAEHGVPTEMKNISSFQAVGRAMIWESTRQIEELKSGGKISRETRRWDDVKNKGIVLRRKEESAGYLYIPEPDLPIINIDDRQLENIRKTLPELPFKKRMRFQNEMGISPRDAGTLTASYQVAELFEKTALICKNPQEAANLIIGDLARLCTETSTLPENLKIDETKLAELIKMIESKQINRTIGKEVLEQIFLNDVEPKEYVKQKGLEVIDDLLILKKTVQQIIKENPKSVADYKNGKSKAFGYLVGQTMKALNGKGNPKLINQYLKDMVDN